MRIGELVIEGAVLYRSRCILLSERRDILVVE